MNEDKFSNQNGNKFHLKTIHYFLGNHVEKLITQRLKSPFYKEWVQRYRQGHKVIVLWVLDVKVCSFWFGLSWSNVISISKVKKKTSPKLYFCAKCYQGID